MGLINRIRDFFSQSEHSQVDTNSDVEFYKDLVEQYKSITSSQSKTMEKILGFLDIVEINMVRSQLNLRVQENILYASSFINGFLSAKGYLSEDASKCSSDFIYGFLKRSKTENNLGQKIRFNLSDVDGTTKILEGMHLSCRDYVQKWDEYQQIDWDAEPMRREDLLRERYGGIEDDR